MRRGCQPAVVALFAIAGLLGSSALLSAAQDGGVPPASGLPDQVYTSPTFGYSVWWNSDWWEAETESSDAGYDLLRLGEPQNKVVFEGITGYGGDAAACVADEVANFSASSSATALEPVLDDEGVTWAQEAPDRSFAMFQGLYDFGDGPDDMVWYIECRTLLPGESVLRIGHLGMAADYDSIATQVDLLLRSVTLPRWYFSELGEYQPEVSPDQTVFPVNLTKSGWYSWAFQPGDRSFASEPVVLFDAADNEIATFTVVTRWTDELSARSLVLLVVENSGFSPLTVDAGDFLLSVLSGEAAEDLRAPTGFQWWSGPDGQQALVQDLGPGEVAVLQLAYPYLGWVDQFAGVNWAASPSDLVNVGYATVGSAGAGSRPKIRTSG